MDDSLDSSDDEADLLIASMARSRRKGTTTSAAGKKEENKSSGSHSGGVRGSNTVKEEDESSASAIGGTDDTAGARPTNAGGLTSGVTSGVPRRTRVFDVYEVSPAGDLTPLVNEGAAIDASSFLMPRRLVPIRPLRKPIKKSAKDKSRIMDLVEAPPIGRAKKKAEKPQPQPPPPPTPRDPKKVMVVKARKRLPKYVAHTGSLLFTEQWLEGRLGKINSRLDERSDSQSLIAKLSNVPGDPFSVYLTVRGRKDLTERLKRSVELRINKQMLMHNLPALLKGGSNLELDLEFDCSLSDDGMDSNGIGAVYHSQSAIMDRQSPLRQHAGGVWVSSAKPGSPIRSALGCAIVTGCAVLKVNHTKVRDVDDIDEAWSKAKKDGKKSVEVTVCLNKDADLSEVDADYLANRHSSRPRRRDGLPYRGRWSFGGGSRSATGRHSKPVAEVKVPSKKRKAAETEPAGQADATTSAPVPKKKSPPPSGDGGRGGEQLAAAYQAFATKYQHLKEIEYKPVNINGQFANGRMWDRHKEIYGSTCNDLCRCPSDLARLTETVIPEHIKKKSKSNRTWSNPQGLNPKESPTGFITHFAPKFYGRIGEEFPDLNHAQRLDMLFKLWEMHKRQQRFGLNCARDCPCGEGWSIFLKNLKQEKIKADRKSSAGLVRRAAGQEAATPSLSRSSSSEGAKQGKKGSLLRHMSAPSNEPREHFSMRFKSGEPLGFYSVNEEKTEKGVLKTSCKIFSVVPNSDPRLKEGTLIVGSAPWSIDLPAESMEPLNTFTELKARYEAARKMKGSPKLRIWFDNSALPPSGLAQKKSSEWSTKGTWKGDPNPNSGWAGGAAVISVETRKTPQVNIQSGKSKGDVPSTGIETRVGKMGSGNSGVSSSLQPHELARSARASMPIVNHNVSSAKPQNADVNETTKRASMAKQILLRHKEMSAASNVGEAKKSPREAQKGPGPSLLRTSKRNDPGRKRGRRVVFSHDPPQTRLFVKDSEWTEQETDTAVEASIVDDQGISDKPSHVEPAQAATIDMDIPIQRRRSDELKKAILHKDYQEVIRQLKDGAHAQSKDSNKKLPREYTKERLETVGQDLKNAHGELGEKLRSIQKDLHLKDTVLKIYIHAEHVLNTARHLQEWVSVDIVPQRAIGLQLTDKGVSHQASDFVFAVVKIDGQVQEPTMPLIPFTDSPDWSTVQNHPVYNLAYNKEMEFSYRRGRKVKVDVVKGSSKTGNNIKLGTWEERVEEIKDALDLWKETDIDHELIRSEFLAAGASMTVKFSESNVDSNFVRHKQLEGSKELSTLIDWIENFRKETEADALDANISLPFVGGLSLLHAAVLLADLRLVYRLLALGADPSLVSTDAGSAENLAGNLVERTADDQVTHGTLVEIMNVLKQDMARRKQSGQVSSARTSSDEKGDGAKTEGSGDAAMVEKGVEKEGELSLTQLASRVQSVLAARSGGQATYAAPAGQQSHPLSAMSQHTQQQTFMDQQTQQFSHVHHAPSLHHNCANVSNVPTQAGHAAVTNSAKAERLPKLINVDWVQGKSERCSNFNKPGGCIFGMSCAKAHIHPPIGFSLDDGTWPDHDVMRYSGELWSAKNMYVHPPIISPAGKHWYTCAYMDPNVRVIFYSERGTSAYLSEQGVYWYPTESAAIVACKRVVLYASKMNTNAGFSSSTPLPPPSLPEPWNNSKGGHGTMDSYFGVFSKLKKADMQAIYNKIFPGNALPRTVWKTSRIKGGQVTTAFHSPAKEDNGGIYYPAEFGGNFDDGKWWYSDEKIAKNSAFMQFLLKCARSGLVTEDLTGTADGRPFFTK